MSVSQGLSVIGNLFPKRASIPFWEGPNYLETFPHVDWKSSHRNSVKENGYEDRPEGRTDLDFNRGSVVMLDLATPHPCSGSLLSSCTMGLVVLLTLIYSAERKGAWG